MVFASGLDWEIRLPKPVCRLRLNQIVGRLIAIPSRRQKETQYGEIESLMFYQRGHYCNPAVLCHFGHYLVFAGRAILRDLPLPESEPIRYPALELGWLSTGLIVSLGLVANAYAGWIPLPRWLYYVAIYSVVLILFIGLRYPTRSLGLAWPSKRAWLALLAAVFVNIGAACLFQIFPPGESNFI
ncbi:MAG: hypothetical protein QY332_10415 [Anaerolineales bacterium]|nr:MAG: hypothetical protein QY332_10415 [Anaerolineales bacterium]